MKKIHVFIRFHLVKISLYTLLLSSIFSCSLDSSEESQCQGILCEFFDELNVQFEETGLEKDQGYVFLKSHSENDSTTQRIIIRSMSGIYYAYKSNEGWYAQKMNDDEKFTINELGHFLAEKEIFYEKEYSLMVSEELRKIRNEFLEYNNNGYKIQTNLINTIEIDTNFMHNSLKYWRKGEISNYDFLDSFNLKKKGLFFSFDSGNYQTWQDLARKNKTSQIGIYDKKKNFYPITNYAFTICYFLNIEDSYEKLISSKKVVTQLIDFKLYNGWYEGNFFIYIPQEKKWYGIDKFADINKKYGILNSNK